MLMQLSDFDYHLPPELIAQHPADQRANSRLLVVEQPLEDAYFHQLLHRLSPNDCLIFNDTKVMKARWFGEKATGGSVELLIERVLPPANNGDAQALAHVRASKRPRVGTPGGELVLKGGIAARVMEERDSLLRISFPGVTDVFSLLEAHGELPLPPYITHTPDATDQERYQTVYANKLGAVAAPTAGLHFTEELLNHIRAKGVTTAAVTLHVGSGTFLPVRQDDISKHVMHSEWYELPQSTVDAIARCKALGGRVVAVGTTTLRALESAGRYITSDSPLKALREDTQIFITPGFEFRVVDRLITNFHLPKSTLMMLVSAFAGYDEIRNAYSHAITKHYRFFSYGDAMLLTRK
jgi:S-adenosylmethionine:tRNA ribosyltransferase-isomerase